MASNGIITAYTYYLVGNVTQVSSICPWLPNQNFTETFSYDSTDQLVSANETQSYQLAVNYGNWGKIMQYDLTQTDMLNNATSQISRSLTYPSHANNVGNSQTPFAPTMQNGDEDVFFTFGINGSLRKREVQTPNPHTEYYLFNSQGNLKAYSDDIMSFAYYGYNAANTRTYKISLYNTNIWINGQQEPLNMQLQQAMFYPNTYLNFNGNGEYTKHYYNGTERIASRLGDNTTTIALNSNILEERKLQLEEQFREDIHKLIEETVPIDLPPFIDVNTLQPTGTPNDIYYYHPNHLGSTSFVTDNNATITQGFLYAPFGEITTEYNINFGNNVIPKYSFNAKELDEETGMFYYEARYYAPPTFTSRDPLFEKYFWMTPYAYCANNPVKYVDPTGKKLKLFDNSFKQQIKEYFIQLFGTSKMFYFNLFNQIKIRKNQFKKVYASMSSDQQKLLDGFRAAIRRKETAIIRVDNNVEKFDFPCYNNVKDDDGNIIETERYLTGFSNLGGGTTSWSDFYSSYLIGVDNAVKDNLTTDEKDIMTGCPAATFVHEALDEFLNYFTAKDVTDNDGKSKRVEYQNTALRILNLPERNGEDHQ